MGQRVALGLVFAWGGLWSGWAADPPADRKPAPDQIRERFHGVWLVEVRTAGGERAVGPDRMVGYLFGADRWYAWDRRGESSAARAERGVRINPTAGPMRFDLLDGADGIRPGIFKFDGDRLVIALAGWVR